MNTPNTTPDDYSPGDASELCPLSNRGKVGTYLYPGDYPQLPYLHPFQDDTGAIHSVDMVRLELQLVPTGDQDKTYPYSIVLDYLTDPLGPWDTLDHYGPYNKPGQYRELIVLHYGCYFEYAEDGSCTIRKDTPMHATVTVGLGLYTGDQLNTQKGFIEFNPNKVARGALAVLDTIQDAARAVFKLSRWDYAIDLPGGRQQYYLHRDARKYAAEISNSITQYLGPRDAVGRVKLYDKTAESKLSASWTRLELTCPRPELTPDRIPQDLPARLWPFVGRVGSAHEVGAGTRTNTALETLSAALVALWQAGQDPEPLLKSLDKRTRSQVRELMHLDTGPARVHFDPRAWQHMAHLALSWETACTNAWLRELVITALNRAEES